MNKLFLKKWKFKPSPHSYSLIPENISFPNHGIEVDVPGDIYMHLLDANLIDDPFHADNELRLGWIAQCDWEYTTEIKDTAQHDTLVFEGLDTIADIYINGNFIEQTKNMFISYSFAVKDYLLKGINTIKIIFHSPLKKAFEMKTAIRQLPSARHKNRVFIRKAQYSFGWDWGPAYPAVGIWRDAYLKLDQLEITRVEFNTLSIENGKATIRIKAFLNDRKSEKLSIKARLFNEDQEFEESVFAENMDEITYHIEIENARLWWPHNMGEPHLYNLQISVQNAKKEEVCSYTKKVGIRKVELKLKDNGINCFRFFINDEALFLKGANWIPADSFLPRVNHEKYESLILAAQQANMNVLRVWGGGIYEDDIFYDLCDREGIVVWQDFMFACATYPDDKDFLENIKEEITQNVQRLKHHPSIIIWCGNNENEWIWYRDGGAVETMQGFKFFHNLLPEWLSKLDASRPYWPSSPFGDDVDPNSEQSGNRHAWHIWSQWVDYTEVKDDKSLFVTEFGFQAPATLETFKTVIPPESLYPQNEIFEFHNKQEEGSERLFRFLSGHLPVKTDIESFIYLTQLNQGLALKTCLDHWRLRWPDTAGSIIWQLNDCWPVSSWSLIDSENRKKHSYYFTKHSFQNILAGVIEKGNKLCVVVLNDNHDDLTGKLKIYIWDFLSNSGQEVKDIELTLKASQKFEWNVPSKTELQNKCMIVTVEDNKGKKICRNFYTEKKWKHVTLPKSDYKIKMLSNNKLSIQSNNILIFLRIEHPEVQMSDLPEVMLPGEVYEIDIAFGELDQQRVKELSVKTLNNYLCET